MRISEFFLRKRILGIFTIMWAIIIFTLSSIPNLRNPEITSNYGFTLRPDYVFHFFVFFILGIAIILWRIPDELKLKASKILIILFAGTAFAIIDETHQLIIPGRSYNPVDLYYNLSGFWAGVFLCYFYLIRHLLVNKQKLSEIKQLLEKRNDS